MDEKFLKPYNPSETEDRIYKMWEDSGYFNPDNLPGDRSETFTITLPPPNVTGVLHIGHAYEDSLQDSVIRYQRMRFKKALWVPGTDSAAIATQARVEKNIQKEEGKNRHDLGREELVKRVSEFAKNSEGTILNQIRKVGASLDWSRYAYTLDEKRNIAVSTAFKRMYDAGLIYRGNRIVNWDPKGQTTVSDDEVVHEESRGKLYTFYYSKDLPIPIATTRPETKIGDTAVAVHPEDKRYKKYIGEVFKVNFLGEDLEIKVIGDEDIDPEFGTGAVGVTPAHSFFDWDLAEKHELKKKQVIDERAKIISENEELSGLKIGVAREYIVEKLKEKNLLEKEEEIDQNIAKAERSGGVIEPLPKLQWWISINKKFKIEKSSIPGIESGSETSLKEIMKKSVESGAVDMPQEGFRRSYFHWVDNLKDWCISRQIWFGHRIPVWYKGEEICCEISSPNEEGWVQEEDVLDTWFSSALWTFSTLGWPEETDDMKVFHPTSLMSPAYEILFLWVSRMILMSGFHLGEVPFKKAIIHGLVKDKKGRKFSKSLGNGVDPLDIIDKYGADALRMGLLTGAAIGNDVKFDESTVKGYKNFANKTWNITRFILDNTQGVDFSEEVSFTEGDRVVLERLEEVEKEVTDDFENYRIYLATEKIYHYIWHEVADKIIEESKPLLNGEDEESKLSRQHTLYEILTRFLKMLHPFMPFVTEEIWQSLPEKDSEMLMISNWPVN